MNHDELLHFVTSQDPEDWTDLYLAGLEAGAMLDANAFPCDRNTPLGTITESVWSGNAALDNYHELKESQAELAYSTIHPEAHLDTTFQEIDNADDR